MGKKTITIESLAKGESETHALVVVREEVKVEGKKVQQPIGEKAISFSNSLSNANVVQLVKAAAVDISKAASDAKTKREALNKLLETEEL